MAFEKLIMAKKGETSKVTWEDPKELENFIQKLQSAGDKLAEHNRRLRNKHQEIIQMVVTLCGIDILKEVFLLKVL